MSWNNAYETKQFKKEQNKLEIFYRANVMSEEQMQGIQAYDKRAFLDKRNRHLKGEEVPMYEVDDNGNEYPIIPDDAYVDEVMNDPFVYGFENDRLNKIWQTLYNETDKKIFVLLSNGVKQPQIALILGMTQQSISKRIKKFQVL